LSRSWTFLRFVDVGPGRERHLRDLPDAELNLFDTGHFALEERLPEIAPLIADFLTRNKV
jgi:hypothetical protein